MESNHFPTPSAGTFNTIVADLKSLGMFDQFRKECIADVDTKPAFQNLKERVNQDVSHYLSKLEYKPGMNKNQMREALRKHVNSAPYLENGLERIVDQVVTPKIVPNFLPKVEEVVNNHFGIKKSQPSSSDVNDLLKDLEEVSSDSEAETFDKEPEPEPKQATPEEKPEEKEEKNTTVEVKDTIEDDLNKLVNEESNPPPPEQETTVETNLKEIFREKIKEYRQMKDQLDDYSKFTENNKEAEKSTVSEDKNKPIRRSRRPTQPTYKVRDRKNRRDARKSDASRSSDSSSDGKKAREEKKSKSKREKSSKKSSLKIIEEDTRMDVDIPEVAEDVTQVPDEERVQIVSEGDSTTDDESSSHTGSTEVNLTKAQTNKIIFSDKPEAEGARVEIVSEDDSSCDSTPSSNTGSKTGSLEVDTITQEEANKIIFG